eukprot:6105708-Prymnesium_polylepis.1
MHVLSCVRCTGFCVHRAADRCAYPYVGCPKWGPAQAYGIGGSVDGTRTSVRGVRASDGKRCFVRV